MKLYKKSVTAYSYETLLIMKLIGWKGLKCEKSYKMTLPDYLYLIGSKKKVKNCIDYQYNLIKVLCSLLVPCIFPYNRGNMAPLTLFPEIKSVPPKII